MKQALFSLSIKLESMLYEQFPILLCFQKAGMGRYLYKFLQFFVEFPNNIIGGICICCIISVWDTY